MQVVYQGVGMVRDMATFVIDESTVNLSGKPKELCAQSYLSRGKESQAFATNQIDWKYQRAVESDLRALTVRVCLLCLDVWCLLRTMVEALVPSWWHYV